MFEESSQGELGNRTNDSGEAQVTTRAGMMGRPSLLPAGACALLVAVLGARVYGAGDTISASGAAIGTWNTTTTFGQTDPNSGAFSMVQAKSVDTEDSPQIDIATIDTPMPYVAGTSYTAGPTQREGTKFKAAATTVATATTVTARTVTWSAAGTVFGIDVKGPSGASPGEAASAMWLVIDPIWFDTLPDDDLLIRYTPGDDWEFHFPDASLNYIGSAKSFGSSGTSIPGLEDLFEWEITMDTQNPGVVNVGFVSNSLLGLNDAAIIADIESRYSYNATTGDYLFDATGFSIAAAFTVPDGVTRLSVTTGYGNQLDAMIPEPATALSLSLAIVALMRRRRT